MQEEKCREMSDSDEPTKVMKVMSQGDAPVAQSKEGNHSTLIDSKDLPPQLVQRGNSSNPYNPCNLEDVDKFPKWKCSIDSFGRIRNLLSIWSNPKAGVFYVHLTLSQ